MDFSGSDDMRKREDYTYYERVRIIAARALQISQGAPVLVSLPKKMVDPLQIARIEWESEIIPIDTRRRAE
jgi:DNA-directed RNA polymerase subunit K